MIITTKCITVVGPYGGRSVRDDLIFSNHAVICKHTLATFRALKGSLGLQEAPIHIVFYFENI